MAKELEKLKGKLEKKGFKGIEVFEKQGAVHLEGELSEWTDIVKAGRLAAKQKLDIKGVVNDVKLSGFTLPPICEPPFSDRAIDGKQPDVLIIGGGVTGCAIARELCKLSLSILLVDKEDDVAMHASSRNDGMIHPGIASHPGTLRGELNVRGNFLYTQLCEDLSVEFKRLSNFILYGDHIFGALSGPVMARRKKLLGIEGQRVSKKKMHELEPYITDEAIGAFEFPSSGVLSPYKLTAALADNAVENGAEISLNTIVKSVKTENGRIESVLTNRGTVYPCCVINAAGCFSDDIAEMAGDRFFTIHPRKGECAILDKKKGPLVQRSMGLVGIKQAFSDTKGGGVMRTIDGNVLVGPDAYEQPYKEDFTTNRDHVDALLEKHLPLIKGFEKSDVITYFAGIRASTYEEEFIVEASERVKNLIHAAGIQSPGLASAPAIAEKIAEITAAVLGKEMKIIPNDKFNPKRNTAPVMAKLSLEDKQKVIKENPDFGIIICRCEAISKGEIAAAVNSPVPALTVDAVKRRVRPGMGRCGGGFCMPQILKIISEQSGIPMNDISKSGRNSEIIIGGDVL